MRKFFLSSIFLSFLFSNSFATVYYVTQNGSGLKTGDSIANAWSAANYNSSSYWAAAPTPGKISPGDTVILSGTITTGLTMQGSGTSGYNIVVDGSAATLSATFTGSNRSYFTLKNTLFSSGMTSTLVALTSSSYFTIDNVTAHNVSSRNQGISMHGSSNGTINSVTMDNSVSDASIYFGTPANSFITVSNCYVRTAVSSTPLEVDIVVNNSGHDLTLSGNYFEMRINGSNHDDVFQMYKGGEGNSSIVYNITLSNNQFVLNTSSVYDKSWLMWEAFYGTINIYGNIFLGIQGASSANGADIGRTVANTTMNIYNNTFIIKNGSPNNTIKFDGAVTGTTVNFFNNIIHGTSPGTVMSNASSSAIINHNYNIYYGGGNYLGNTCSNFKAINESCSSDPMFRDISRNDFRISSSSPAFDSGTSLGASFNKSLSTQSANWPNPLIIQRPQSTAWDIGAYEVSSGSVRVPFPPSVISVH